MRIRWKIFAVAREARACLAETFLVLLRKSLSKTDLVSAAGRDQIGEIDVLSNRMSCQRRNGINDREDANIRIVVLSRLVEDDCRADRLKFRVSSSSPSLGGSACRPGAVRRPAARCAS